MSFSHHFIDYATTGYFSKLIIDYLQEAKAVKPFYQYSPQQPDFKEIINQRVQQSVNREVLVKVLQEQYQSLETSEAVNNNIQLLARENTFTVCTAHQPNLFTGHLYFIYKILHIIKLAEDLKKQFPDHYFVPVYYMGSEDNDLEELGHIYLEGEKLEWQTEQQGAVGRMDTKGIEKLVEHISNHVGYTERARSLVALLKKAYLKHSTIQEATLFLVNALFQKFGLVILIADHPLLKKEFATVMKDELLNQHAFEIVNKTNEALNNEYKVQASPREINLFYLKGNLRERIIKKDNKWLVLNTELVFSEAEILRELETYSERFSPNVILRGLYQEKILPNLAFIGGGGELAYWLQLKALFEHYHVHYPLLLLRNSFLWINDKQARLLKKVDLQPQELFKDSASLINEYAQKHAVDDLDIKEQKEQMKKLFEQLKEKAKKTDVTLEASVAAEHTKVNKSFDKIAKKMLRAEKKKFDIENNRIKRLKEVLFPGGQLQERIDSFLPYYATYGNTFIDELYNSADPFSDQLQLITAQPDN